MSYSAGDIVVLLIVVVLLLLSSSPLMWSPLSWSWKFVDIFLNFSQCVLVYVVVRPSFRLLLLLLGYGPMTKLPRFQCGSPCLCLVRWLCRIRLLFFRLLGSGLVLLVLTLSLTPSLRITVVFFWLVCRSLSSSPCALRSSLLLVIKNLMIHPFYTDTFFMVFMVWYDFSVYSLDLLVLRLFFRILSILCSSWSNVSLNCRHVGVVFFKMYF